ncbi:MAG: GlmU family protein [Bacteroidota bacterium]
MKYILFDNRHRAGLLPFTHTRPVADIRCGIYTMRERWEHCLQATTGTLTEAYMQPVFPAHAEEDNVYINGGIFATTALAAAITQLEAGHALVNGEQLIAARIAGAPMAVADFHAHAATLPAHHTDSEITELQHTWDIFALNDKAIRADYQLATEGRKSREIPEGVTVTGKDNLFIEEGANIYPGCIINAATGPVYIGRDVEILEGTLIRGPLAVCEHGVIKMGGKMYGATTIGPGCKVGGEINNAVFFANSNKAHDGYLGNAVIGEWCNLGADTNCSNLKNNYDGVQVWDEAQNKSVNTGLTFCGLMMGDHSKCAINTMFNTGTVVAVSCNIFGAGFPGKFIQSFSWGSSEKTIGYDFTKAMETANRMMGRRAKQLSEAETAMYRYIFDNYSKAGKKAVSA